MIINIRPAKESDQAAIREIVRGAKLWPFELDWQGFYVAVHRGSIVGVGQIKTHRDGGRELASVAVIPEFRRQGAAAALIRELISVSDDDLYLLCRLELEKFYQRYGFITLTQADLPAAIARRQRMANFFFGMVSVFSRRPLGILAMGLPAGEKSKS